MVLNLSQQTDSSDLVGGFKPVEPRDALLPLLDTFQCLVRLTWSKGNNEDFLGRVTKYAQRQKWSSLLKAFQTAVQKAGSSSQLAFDGKAALAKFQHKLLCHLVGVESTHVAFACLHRSSSNKLRRQTACCPASQITPDPCQISSGKQMSADCRLLFGATAREVLGLF